ncbi:YihY/virulence factor BrkB family protein [Cuneatibacter sp. NSJ-177]|jgi:membrane protein|uniref:YihY/virulence factor BrkB family protein n=1 Tax=Cuneatibacter sp. NSJ-177 TaxID=2931401 RepID=UPI001FD310DC|nr:YihY/virulence factor BrkB family protein [Cuneatibacter sp. NSJ-177]MCJ7835589.1 YihY/virulence factor BrkB family protein [Cuneatibacter sp. NSJ-177]
MKDWQKRIFEVSKKVSGDQIPVYGAQASFFIVVSVIPFAMALVSLIQFFIPASKMEALSYVVNLLPASLSQPVESAIDDLFTNSAPSIVSISLLVAVWSASKGVLALERCLHVIYRVTDHQNFILRRLRAVLYTLFFLVVLVMALGLLVFGNSIQAAASAHFPMLNKIAPLIFGLRSLMSTAVFVAGFSGIYMVLSGAKRRFFQVLPGVLFSTAGWTIFSLGYAYYITNFSNYTYIYGSLGAIILMMLWLYFCILILLAGAELNVFLESHSPDHKSHLPAVHEPEDGSKT